MESQRAYLSEYLSQSEKSSFEELFSQMNDRIQAIFTFLALLEMVQQKMINLLVGEGRNNFIFERNDEGG
ncbi:segregation and condensation protein A [compost metagenome]